MLLVKKSLEECYISRQRKQIKRPNKQFSNIFPHKNTVIEYLLFCRVSIIIAIAIIRITSQQASTCSKLTIETLDQGVKYL